MAGKFTPRTPFTSTVNAALSETARRNLTTGFAATAYALREGKEKPLNPHGTQQENMVAGDSAKWEAFSAWREGAQAAERYWQDWSFLPASHAAEFERAAELHYENVVKPAQAAKEAQPATAATGGERIKGFSPISGEQAERANACKMAEEKVLRIIDALHTELQNEVGDIAADEAAFKESGYKRMTPEAQKAKHDELAQRYAAAQGALRWLALGKTDIEKGFMAVNRSIFRPSRIELPEDSED